VSPDEREILTDEDEVACAPESGQPAGGRPNPWDDDDEEPVGVRHAYPADHHQPPGDDL
jgi:hypothetical protein